MRNPASRRHESVSKLDGSTLTAHSRLGSRAAKGGLFSPGARERARVHRRSTKEDASCGHAQLIGVRTGGWTATGSAANAKRQGCVEAIPQHSILMPRTKAPGPGCKRMGALMLHLQASKGNV